MTRLVIQVDVPDDAVDPTLEDPHVIAEDVIDAYQELRRYGTREHPEVTFVAAEWAT